ncbi:hypothetical protein SUGI_0840130 [Cryptomeria japonica]|nr:hypothetical protein SUGI_0840130 [Cryptomeria japonica]
MLQAMEKRMILMRMRIVRANLWLRWPSFPYSDQAFVLLGVFFDVAPSDPYGALAWFWLRRFFVLLGFVFGPTSLSLGGSPCSTMARLYFWGGDSLGVSSFVAFATLVGLVRAMVYLWDPLLI